MGRSRGGLTTKIHALCDANGLPIALKLTEGQAHDGRSAADMLSGLGRIACSIKHYRSIIAFAGSLILLKSVRTASAERSAYPSPP